MTSEDKDEIEALSIRIEHLRDALSAVVSGLDGREAPSRAMMLAKAALDADTAQSLKGLDHNGLRLRIGGIHLTLAQEPEQKGPVPLLVRRASEEEANLWATSDGSGVYRDREWAERVDYMKTDAYYQESRTRNKAGHLVRAKVVEDYDGYVTTDGDDYARDVPELLEKVRDRLIWEDVPEEEVESRLPAWVYCCSEDGFEFDIEEEISNYVNDNHHEDAIDYIKDWESLRSFWSEWSSKQTDLRSYMIDYSRIVVLDRARYEAELADAKAYLEKFA